MPISARTGLIPFPGLGDLDFIPPTAQFVQANVVTAEEEALWDEFLETVESFPNTSGCWDVLVDVVYRYLSGTEMVALPELDRAARQALLDFFTHSVPLHLSHMLVGTGGAAYLVGRSGRGTLTLEKIKTSLIEVLGRQETAEAETFACVALAAHRSRVFLAEIGNAVGQMPA